MRNNNDSGFNPCDFDEDGFDRKVPENENYYSHNYQNQYSNNINYDDFEPYPQSDTENEFERNYNSFNNAENKTARNDFNRDFKNKPTKKGKNKSLKILISVLSVLLVFAIAIGSVAGSVLGKINYKEKEENKYVENNALMSSASVKNILLLGIDRRSETESVSRADTMMLISIDKKHNTVKMTSFLRDTWLYIPCHDGSQRLNAACSYGGYNGVKDTIEYNFGVKIDGYVLADFNMFEIIVDALGGVEVEVTEKEAKEVTSHKKRYGNVTLEAGKQNLTGEQALAYCRIRKIDTDFKRTERQRTVMSSIINKVKKNPLKLYSIAKQIAPYIETSLNKGEIVSSAFSALPCLSNIMQQEIPAKDTWKYAKIKGNSVIKIDEKKNKEILIDFIYNKDKQETEKNDKQ